MAKVYATTPGRVSEVFVEPGSRVTKGQLLVRLTNDEKEQKRRSLEMDRNFSRRTSSWTAPSKIRPRSRSHRTDAGRNRETARRPERELSLLEIRAPVRRRRRGAAARARAGARRRPPPTEPLVRHAARSADLRLLPDGTHADPARSHRRPPATRFSTSTREIATTSASARKCKSSSSTSPTGRITERSKKSPDASRRSLRRVLSNKAGGELADGPRQAGARTTNEQRLPGDGESRRRHGPVTLRDAWPRAGHRRTSLFFWLDLALLPSHVSFPPVVRPVLC